MRQEAWRLLFNQVAPTYEKEFYGNPFADFCNEITWLNIKKYLPPEKQWPILDAGGGTGFWSRKIAELGYKAVCLDISEEMLAEGRKTAKDNNLASGIEFVNGDVEEMSQFPNGSFSFVLAEGEILSYCDNPTRAVKEMVRVAKEGAYVVVSVDSFFGALIRMFKSQDFKELQMLLRTGDTTYKEGCVQHNFTVEELRNLYVQNDLEVIEIIGKPVLTMAIPWERMGEVLIQENTRAAILELESRFNSNSSLVGLGNHLEIVGRKNQ